MKKLNTAEVQSVNGGQGALALAFDLVGYLLRTIK